MRAATRANPTSTASDAGGPGDPAASLLERIRRGATTEDSRAALPLLFGQARRLAAGLVLYGLEPGDRVAVLARVGRPALGAILAAATADGVAVPLDPSSSSQEWMKALAENEVRFAVAEDAAALERLLALRPDLPALELAFVIRPPDGDRPSPARTIEAVSADGEGALAADPGILERARGTSGGAVLATPRGSTARGRSLAEIERAARETAGVLTAAPEDVVLIALELDGACDLDAVLGALLAGATVVCPGTEPGATGSALRAVRPMIAVVAPEEFERIEAAIEAAIEARGILGRRVALWSLARAREAERRPRAARLGRRLILDRLSEETTGGRLRRLACPGTPPRADRIAALGVVARGLPPRT